VFKTSSWFEKAALVAITLMSIAAAVMAAAAPR
jgi:hypothetical protein